AFLHQLRSAERPGEVDAGSPYFAHLRFAEQGRTHDILLGKTSRLLPDVPIVDWRNAPVSRLFYRYRQGEEYEETIAGRVRTGEVVARRTLTIREGILRRIDAPEAAFEAEGGDSWRQLERLAARLGGGQQTALRIHDVEDQSPAEERRLGTDLAGVRRRADKH